MTEIEAMKPRLQKEQGRAGATAEARQGKFVQALTPKIIQRLIEELRPVEWLPAPDAWMGDP